MIPVSSAAMPGYQSVLVPRWAVTHPSGHCEAGEKYADWVIFARTDSAASKKASPDGQQLALGLAFPPEHSAPQRNKHGSQNAGRGTSHPEGAVKMVVRGPRLVAISMKCCKFARPMPL
jgi:hypothetical protein